MDPIQNLSIEVPASLLSSPGLPTQLDTLKSDETAGRQLVRTDLLTGVFGAVIDTEVQDIMGLPIIMDEIKYIVERDSKVTDPPTPWLSGNIYDLGLVARLQNELNNHLPWAAGFLKNMITHRKWLDEEILKVFGSQQDTERNMMAIKFLNRKRFIEIFR